MSIALSICIPSYNRVQFLPDLLNSIFSQWDERVEVVICDNGSSDGTESLVQTYQKKYPGIVYDRFQQNVGPDRCFLRSIERASGVFCWLMGDDDIIEEGAIAHVLSFLREGVTGMTVNRRAYDRYLNRSWMEPSRKKGNDHFLNAEPCFSSLFTSFGFLSAQIVKRDAWMSVVREEDVSPYFNAYVLIYIIGRMIQKEPSWLYLERPCVGWRSGNDSFALELGRHRRFELDVVSYESIARGLFSSEPSFYKKIMKEVTSLHLLGHIRDLKFSGKILVYKSLTLCIPKLYNISSFWLRVFPVILTPRWALLLLRPLYRKLIGVAR